MISTLNLFDHVVDLDIADYLLDNRLRFFIDGVGGGGGGGRVVGHQWLVAGGRVAVGRGDRRFARGNWIASSASHRGGVSGLTGAAGKGDCVPPRLPVVFVGARPASSPDVVVVVCRFGRLPISGNEPTDGGGRRFDNLNNNN